MNTIVHFMVPADDTERAQQFYKNLFDWEINKLPGPMDYWEVNTKADENAPGINGGIGKRTSEKQIVNYIGVDDIEAVLPQIEANGGKIVEGKMPVPGFGAMAVCMDTENNLFGLWEDEK